MHFIDVDRENDEDDFIMEGKVSDYVRCLKDECQPKGEDKVSIVQNKPHGPVGDWCMYR